jgi:hypothetical protein
VNAFVTIVGEEVIAENQFPASMVRKNVYMMNRHFSK